MVREKYWVGSVEDTDDFGERITDVFYDAATLMGPWAIMSPRSFHTHGYGRVGTGMGQKYEKQADGRWLKTEG